MAININKGGKLGKYFYLKSEVEYGPVELTELLENIDKNTLVYYQGINWTSANEITELKKYFTTEERVIEKVVERVIETTNVESIEVKKNYLIPILLILILLGGVYWYNDYNNKVNEEEIARQRKEEADSLLVINDMILAEETKRKQDSIFYASSAMLDSAKMIKLDIDYQLGIEKVKNLITGFFSELTNRTSNIQPYFSDTVLVYFDNIEILKQDLINGLNSYNERNTSLSEIYQFVDSTCSYDSLEGNLGVYKFNFYYITKDNSNQNLEKYELISACLKINPNFQIVYYNWINREQIESIPLNN